MSKFYVESGRVRLIFDATTAQQAAVMAFWDRHGNRPRLQPGSDRQA